MQGVIHNYRRSRHSTSGNQMVVIADDVDSKEKAQELVGRKVLWHTGKRKISGEVRAPHGNSGALRVLFETGMPGQALGQRVEIE